jgi:outer membrane protein OmpA-like peptidoglycan-associated protein
MSWSDSPRRRLRAGVAAAAALAALATSAAAQPAGYGGPGDRTFGEAVRGNFAIHAGLGASPSRLERLSEAFESAAPGRLLFDFDSATLDAEARKVLAAQARWLRLNPHATLRLEGHADRVGGEPYNERLGLRRARAVAHGLVALGVHPGRLATLESRGETRPAVETEGRERRNRRVVVALVGWGRPMPTDGFDGNRALNAYRRYISDEVEEAAAEGAGDS